MASISSPGVGSGLDVNSLVTKLVAAERAPKQNQIDAQRTQYTAQVSAIGKLKSSLSALQTALAGLADGSAFSKFLATSSATTHFSASVDATASAGNYAINVERLATAEKASSGVFPANATFASGAITISVGSQSLTLDPTTAGNTLSSLASAINRSPQNPGVSAAVVHATDGDHLVLTSTQTGAANAFTVAATGDYASLAYDPAHGVHGLSTVTSGVDAKLSVDGFEVTSASNAVTGAVQGVTINLAALSGDTPDTLTVAADTASIQTSVKALVTSYNAFVALSKQLTSYDSASGTAGAMLGDSTLLSIGSRLAHQLGSVVGSSGSAVQSLGDLGIRFEVDGTLSLDTDKLGAALTAHPEQVKSLFSNGSGYGADLTPLLAGYLQSGGILDGRSASLAQNTRSLDDQQTQLDARMDQLTLMYQTQFTQLDTLLTSLKSTSSFLTQQLAVVSASK